MGVATPRLISRNRQSLDWAIGRAVSLLPHDEVDGPLVAWGSGEGGSFGLGSETLCDLTQLTCVPPPSLGPFCL